MGRFTNTALQFVAPSHNDVPRFPTQTIPYGQSSHSLTWGGRTRTFIVHRPNGLSSLRKLFHFFLKQNDLSSEQAREWTQPPCSLHSMAMARALPLCATQRMCPLWLGITTTHSPSHARAPSSFSSKKNPPRPLPSSPNPPSFPNRPLSLARLSCSRARARSLSLSPPPSLSKCQPGSPHSRAFSSSRTGRLPRFCWHLSPGSV